MIKSEELDHWLRKIVSLTNSILTDLDDPEFDFEQAIDNRGRLIDILKNQKSPIGPAQQELINNILATDKLIEKKLEFIRSNVKQEIKKNFIRKEKIKKFNLQNLQG